MANGKTHKKWPYGLRLKAIRESHVPKMTQDALAARTLGAVSPGAVKAYEQGLRTPKLKAIVALARALNVELGDIDPALAPLTHASRSGGRKRARLIQRFDRIICRPKRRDS